MARSIKLRHNGDKEAEKMIVVEKSTNSVSGPKTISEVEYAPTEKAAKFTPPPKEASKAKTQEVVKEKTTLEKRNELAMKMLGMEGNSRTM